MDIYDTLFAEEEETHQQHQQPSCHSTTTISSKRPLPVPISPPSSPVKSYLLRIATTTYDLDPTLQEANKPPTIFAPNHLEALKTWLTQTSSSSSSSASDSAMSLERDYHNMMEEDQDMLIDHDHPEEFAEWKSTMLNPSKVRAANKALVEEIKQRIESRPGHSSSSSNSSSKKRKMASSIPPMDET